MGQHYQRLNNFLPFKESHIFLQIDSGVSIYGDRSLQKGTFTQKHMDIYVI